MEERARTGVVMRKRKVGSIIQKNMFEQDEYSKMSKPNPESTPPPTQTTIGAPGSASLSRGASRSSGNREENSRTNDYGRNRGDKNIITVSSTDREYKGWVCPSRGI